MRGAETGIYAAQNDFRLGLQAVDIIDDFAYAEIPIGHYCLNKDRIESLSHQKLNEIFARTTESIKATRDVRKSRRPDGGLLIEPAATKTVTLSRNQIIERCQLAPAKLTADAEETIRAQPEVEGSEIVDR